MIGELGFSDPKTLHRRREDYQDKDVRPCDQFLKHGIHYRRKSPNCCQIVWDLEATLRAWDEAIAASGVRPMSERHPPGLQEV